MLIINLFGAPGAGKSTGAAYIFSQLKAAGVNAELVTEFAKDKVWEETKAVFENQAYIFGKQYYRISRLVGKVDAVVTDSPVLLSAFYNKNDEILGDEFNVLVAKVFNYHPHLDVFVKRAKPYNPAGRFQTEEESDNLSDEMRQFLKEYGVGCIEINGDFTGYDLLVRQILERLGKPCNAANTQTIRIRYQNGDSERLDYIGGKSDWIDLRASEDVELKKGEHAKIPLGIAMQLPKGYEAHIVPRSSTFEKFGLKQFNSIGIVDESYCGDNDWWSFAAQAERDTVIHAGDRICQFRIMEHQPEIHFEEVETLGNPDRGGFGTTGMR